MGAPGTKVLLCLLNRLVLRSVMPLGTATPPARMDRIPAS